MGCACSPAGLCCTPQNTFGCGCARALASFSLLDKQAHDLSWDGVCLICSLKELMLGASLLSAGSASHGCFSAFHGSLSEHFEAPGLGPHTPQL